MQIAQINIAKMKAPLESPIMADFVANLDRINGIAESSNGFVWRLKDENNNATSIKVFDDDYILVNMSVWENIDALFNFAYKSQHAEIFKRREEWFDKMSEMHMAIWYIANDQYPPAAEGAKRLEHIREHGDTPYSFSFKKKFTPIDLEKYLSGL
jgi:hypothetical protein